MNKHLNVLFVVVVIMALVVTGCGPTPTPTKVSVPTEAPAPTPMSEGKPVSGGTLTMAIRMEILTLDPVFATSWPFTHSASHIFDALLSSDNEGNMYPALTENWEVSEDAMHYTFHLRKDVQFHDGTPFNAEAVKYHLDRVKDPEWCCGNAYEYVGPYESSEILDEYTIRVNFTKPWGPFETYAGDFYTMSIVSPAAVEEWGREVAMHPVGTGPFKFVEWVPQDHLTLERNPDYNWAPEIFDHQGPAYLDKIVVKFIGEPGTRLACLQSGECDVIKDPSFPDIQALRDDPNFRVIKVPEKGAPYSWSFNTVKPPTDDVSVRKALNLAVNREMINESVFNGERAPYYTVLTSATPEYWPGSADHIYYDPEEAKAILEESGWVDTDGDGIREKDGQPLKIELVAFGAAENNPRVMICEVIQANLKEVGCDAHIQIVPLEDHPVVAMSKEYNLIYCGMAHINATVLGVMYHSREAPSEGHYGMGWTWFHEDNPELSQKLDDLLDEADRTAGFEERKQLYWEAQKIIAENHLAMPISQGYEIFAVSESVHDIKFNGANTPSFYDTWIEQ